jgi:hypothetical protein
MLPARWQNRRRIIFGSPSPTPDTCARARKFSIPQSVERMQTTAAKRSVSNSKGEVGFVSVVEPTNLAVNYSLSKTAVRDLSVVASDAAST